MDKSYTNKCECNMCLTCKTNAQESSLGLSALEKKNLILEFLNKKLNESELASYQRKVESISKSTFCIEIQYGNPSVINHVNIMEPSIMTQVIDQEKFQRMKKIGTSQSEIQIILLEEYFKQLQNGRDVLVKTVQDKEEPSSAAEYVAIQCLSEMSSLLDKFRSMLVPGKLFEKHRLISGYVGLRAPKLQLVLKHKAPVIFDRQASVAHARLVSLKWHTLEETSETDVVYELCYKIKKDQATDESSNHGVIFSCRTSSFDIHNLLEDQLYEFSIRRWETDMLVYEAWHDIMTLKTLKMTTLNTQETQNPTELHCVRGLQRLTYTRARYKKPTTFCQDAKIVEAQPSKPTQLAIQPTEETQSINSQPITQRYTYSRAKTETKINSSHFRQD